MKTVFLFLFSLSLSSVGLSQDFYSDFEDGTLQGWTNKDGSTTMIGVQFGSTASDNYLHKICDGSMTPVGEMTILNQVNWVGNYFYEPGGGDEAMLNLDFITLRNTNDFDLHIRYGFTGANGYVAVTTDPIIVPALSDWNVYENAFNIVFPGIYNLTILTDTTGLPFLEYFNNVHDLFEDVVEVRIFHNEAIAYDGEFVSGTLDVDKIEAFILLSNEDQKKPEVEFFPNPAVEFVSIRNTSLEKTTISIYNLLGEKVQEQLIISGLTKLDISNLNTGIYLATFKTESATFTKKLVKL